jgi:hypothetical protein
MRAPENIRAIEKAGPDMMGFICWENSCLPTIFFHIHSPILYYNIYIYLPATPFQFTTNPTDNKPQLALPALPYRNEPRLD